MSYECDLCVAMKLRELEREKGSPLSALEREAAAHNAAVEWSHSPQHLVRQLRDLLKKPGRVSCSCFNGEEATEARKLLTDEELTRVSFTYPKKP